MSNKVKFGLSKAYYAVYNESEKTYGAPVALPGAKSLSISAEGDESTIYADNIAWYTQNANAGYSGTLEIMEMPEQAFIDLLGQEKDSNGVLVEGSDDRQKTFALLFEIAGDQINRRVGYYNCTLSRPSTEANTKEDTINPDTDTMNIRMLPRIIEWGEDTKNLVKAVCTDEEATKSQYDAWYTQVYVPTKASA